VWRGLLVAAPVTGLLLLEFAFDDRVVAGIATAAAFAGFVAFDAPARVRARWQAATAPVLGLATLIGVLSSQTTATAIVAMALAAGLGGYCVAVSQRFSIAAITCVLGVLIAQGLAIEADAALRSLVFATLGGLTQAGWALLVWALLDRASEPESARLRWSDARAALRDNLTLGSPSMRHAIRWAVALAVGVAIYRVVDLGVHGYWVPLTILFVLRPGRDETVRRLAMRAVGTLVGLLLATAIAELLGEQVVIISVVLGVAIGFAYAFLALEYAVFTTAITIYIVLLSDALGFSAIDAAGERALATGIGIAVAGLAFLALGERAPGRDTRSGLSPARRT
jgi:hypothetical protein